MSTKTQTEEHRTTEPVGETEVRRIDRKYLADSVLSAFYLEKGLLFTIRQLLLRPGKGLYEFLFTAKRSLYTKPLGFLILSSSIAAIIAFSFSDFQDNFISGFNEEVSTGASEERVEKIDSQDIEIAEGSQGSKADKQKVVKKNVELITGFYSQHFNLFLILFVPFCAVFCYLLLRKDKWFFTEHLVSNAYLVSIQNIISIPFFLLTDYSLYIIWVYTFTVVAYQVFFYNRVYRSAKGFTGMLRIFGVITLSTFTYMMALTVLLVGAMFLL
ncbi:MAG: hypothetical protein WBB45_05405 [Cyclobacteriaceae bacterium]